MRPPSIVMFERLYAAALIISIAASGLNWTNEIAQLVTRPQVAELHGAAHIVPTIYLVLRALIWAGWALLLFLVARRASTVAKWLVVVCAAVAAIDGVITLLAVLGGPLAGWSPVAAIVETVLVVSSAALLFRPDARGWFAGAGGGAETTK